jgi:CRISPR/Cas system type I-B associated protein Csh2 (Cas7 group RAMP superfamily)
VIVVDFGVKMNICDINRNFTEFIGFSGELHRYVLET